MRSSLVTFNQKLLAMARVIVVLVPPFKVGRMRSHQALGAPKFCFVDSLGPGAFHLNFEGGGPTIKYP